MSREIRIPHNRIKTGHDCTVATEQAFQGQDLNLHVHEVERMEDDETRGERVLTVKTTKYFFQGGR